MIRYFERRYHATFYSRRGFRSPLSKLGSWVRDHPGALMCAPHDLLTAAQDDVIARLPSIAAREPTRRHRKHFTWLLGWHARITAALRKNETIHVH